MTVWTIVVAGGAGTRFGGAKQFARLAGTSVLDRSVATAMRCSVGGVVVVVPAGASWSAPAGVLTACGAATRSGSVRTGLALVEETAEIIVVHDAARPLASPLLYQAVIAAVRNGADAAVPGIAINDTIKRVEGTRVVATIPRAGLVTVQTPQAFSASALRAAHIDARNETDDAALVEAAGGFVVVVPGEARNLKITQPADLEVAAALLDAP